MAKTCPRQRAAMVSLIPQLLPPRGAVLQRSHLVRSLHDLRPGPQCRVERACTSSDMELRRDMVHDRELRSLRFTSIRPATPTGLTNRRGALHAAWAHSGRWRKACFEAVELGRRRFAVSVSNACLACVLTARCHRTPCAYRQQRRVGEAVSRPYQSSRMVATRVLDETDRTGL